MITNSRGKQISIRRRNLAIFWKVLLWWFGNIGFGLTPCLIVMLLGWLNINPDANTLSFHELEHLFNDGVINFFLLAIMGSIAVDIFCTRIKFKFHFALTMILIALACAFIVSLAYSAFVLQGHGKTHFGEQKTITVVMMIIAVLYCSFGKASLLLKEYKK